MTKRNPIIVLGILAVFAALIVGRVYYVANHTPKKTDSAKTASSKKKITTTPAQSGEFDNNAFNVKVLGYIMAPDPSEATYEDNPEQHLYVHFSAKNKTDRGLELDLSVWNTVVVHYNTPEGTDVSLDGSDVSDLGDGLPAGVTATPEGNINPGSTVDFWLDFDTVENKGDKPIQVSLMNNDGATYSSAASDTYFLK